MEGHKPWRQNLEISTPERHRSYALLTVLHLRLQDPRKGVPRGRTGPQNKDSRRQELDTGTFCRWPTRDLWKGGSSRPSVAIPLEVFCSHRHPSHSGEPSGGSRTQPPREVLLRLSQIQVPTFPGSTNTLARHGRRVPIVEFAPRAQLRGAESPPPHYIIRFPHWVELVVPLLITMLSSLRAHRAGCIGIKEGSGAHREINLKGITLTSGCAGRRQWEVDG